jgi:hypothetical protein
MLVNVMRRWWREDGTVGRYSYLSGGCESEIQDKCVSAKMSI